jgi:hypothetical protein
MSQISLPAIDEQKYYKHGQKQKYPWYSISLLLDHFDKPPDIVAKVPFIPTQHVSNNL